MYEELDSQKLSQYYSKKDQMDRSKNDDSGNEDAGNYKHNSNISSSTKEADDSNNPFERERKPRSADEMAAEAAILRSLFEPSR